MSTLLKTGRVLLSLALLFGLVGSAAAQSQITTGVIEGTVSDESGGVLPSAEVEVRNPATNFNRTLTTVDFTGTKSFVLTLRKGVYRFFCDPHASVMHGSFRAV